MDAVDCYGVVIIRYTVQASHDGFDFAPQPKAPPSAEQLEASVMPDPFVVVVFGQ